MGYLDNYNAVRNRYKKYLTSSQSKKLKELSAKYNRQDAYNRKAAADTLRTGFQQGFSNLRNIGMQSSGEEARLKKKLAEQFTTTNDALNKNELSTLREQGYAMKKATIRARNKARDEWLREQAGRSRIAGSGTRGRAGGGRMLKETR